MYLIVDFKLLSIGQLTHQAQLSILLFSYERHFFESQATLDHLKPPNQKSMDQATHMQRLRRIDKSLTVIDTRQVDRSSAQCSICWQSLLLASKFNDTNGHDPRNGKPINEDSSGQVHIHGESIEPGSMEEKKVPDEECKTEVPETHIPVQLRCGHTFGRVCITEWLMSGNSCPMCRAKVLLIRVVLKERNLDLRI